MFLYTLIRRALSAVLLLAIIIPGYVSMQIWLTGHKAKPMKSDAILIMGAAQFNGRPSDILQERINEAYRIYSAGLSSRILTVGAAAAGDNFSEAASSYNALLKLSVGRSHLTAIPVGSDTLASTIAYVSLMKFHGWKSVIIVTDPYHCYRSISMATDLGIKATCAPARTGPGSITKTGIRYIARETGAYLAYKTVGQFGIHLSDQVKN